MAETLCCPPATIATLLICYTPIQNVKVQKNIASSDHHIELGGSNCFNIHFPDKQYEDLKKMVT